MSSTLVDILSLIHLFCRASLRFFILRLTHQPLVSPPIPEREFDPTTLPPSSDASSSTPELSTNTPQHLHNNYVQLPLHSLLSEAQMDTSAEEYLLPKALTTSSVKPSLSLVRTLSGPRDWIAESLYILRPLVYGTECWFGVLHWHR